MYHPMLIDGEYDGAFRLALSLWIKKQKRFAKKLVYTETAKFCHFYTITPLNIDQGHETDTGARHPGILITSTYHPKLVVLSAIGASRQGGRITPTPTKPWPSELWKRVLQPSPAQGGGLMQPSLKVFTDISNTHGRIGLKFDTAPSPSFAHILWNFWGHMMSGHWVITS